MLNRLRSMAARQVPRVAKAVAHHANKCGAAAGGLALMSVGASTAAMCAPSGGEAPEVTRPTRLGVIGGSSFLQSK